jgi:serine O-acetyltransferase
MIESRSDYEFYLEADRLALRMSYRRPRMFGDEIWKYERLLRCVAWRTNAGSRLPLGRLRLLVTRWRLHELGIRLGFSIGPNTFGPGLSINHIGTIVVNPQAQVGANCSLHVCVNIGAQAGTTDVPVIGNNVYIGPGAKVFGDIVIGDDTAIGANAVVNRSFPEGHCTLGGVPARVISPKTSEGLLTRGSELAMKKGGYISSANRS